MRKMLKKGVLIVGILPFTIIAQSYQRSAYFVERILKGNKPADLPVEQPKKFEFIVNLKAAKLSTLRYHRTCSFEQIELSDDRTIQNPKAGPQTKIQNG